MTSDTNKSSRRLGALTGVVMSVFGKKRSGAAKDSENMEFKSSTGRMGVRFTEKVRNSFRRRWMRKV